MPPLGRNRPAHGWLHIAIAINIKQMYSAATLSGGMMDHEEAFLQAVCERPADNEPRLVFADWLEKHGQRDRAEFIRLQCEVRRRLPDREQELLRIHQDEWTAPLRRLVPELREANEPCGRGFPSGITLR